MTWDYNSFHVSVQKQTQLTIGFKIILYRLADIETWHNDFKNLARREGIEPPFYA